LSLCSLKDNQYAKTYIPNWGMWASIKNTTLEKIFLARAIWFEVESQSDSTEP
jgi:hypothetical protein